MGRIFQPTKKQPDGSKWTSPKWYAEFTDERGKRKRVPASTNKREAQDLLVSLEAQVVRIRNGLEVRTARTLSTKIADLVEQFLADQKLHLKPVECPHWMHLALRRVGGGEGVGEEEESLRQHLTGGLSAGNRSKSRSVLRT